MEANELASRAQHAINFFQPLGAPLAARAALWANDLGAANAAMAALNATMIRGEALSMDKTSIAALVAALQGRSAEALGLYREALAGWRRLGLAWDEALTVIDMAKFIGPAEPDVQTAAEWALTTLGRLGAKPYIERLQAAMRASSATDAAAASSRSQAKASVS
jgi:hypothetical protein